MTRRRREMEALAEMQRRERELMAARKKYDEMMKRRFNEEQEEVPELDITRWRNLAGQLEELAAWISSREPKCGELDKINLDTKVLCLF